MQEEIEMADWTTHSVTGIRTVAVPVTDHERALGFYRDTLGFEVRMDATFGPGMRWVEVAPAGAETTIALAPPGDTRPGVDSGIRLGTKDATAEHERLRSAGIDVDDDVMRVPGVPPMFSFRDADGNRLYIVENASGSEA
jgi:predicted enzyme related to lactoylglutathione lyase